MSEQLERSGRGGILQEFKLQIFTLGELALLLWVIEIVNVVLGLRLASWGILPRQPFELWRILVSPFLHFGFAHLAANTLPFLVLGWLIMLRSMSDFVMVSVVTGVGSGLGVWLFSPTYSVTVGASGVIFGYFGFLLARAWFERSLVAIGIAATVMFLYGGIIWGIFPTQLGVSWQAHLFGFLVGILAARWYRSKKSKA
ncbi:MAG: rhomboid family intramembrane serine protease [Pseudanabaenaceae cyanobacterium bins.68]|nr:rhomboid family intramembrane serine protease [Pseudanabaenaceae cyanobacterium bins.68]